jgi:phosphatidylserine/phosphatidylglycerophosphate/cardiolipin synthase-like enzyme
MKLIVEPADGVAPLLAAIKSAKKRVEIAIFRFDRTDVESALKAAAKRGVKVTALIAFNNRGGEQRLRKLELRCLAAGIIVARTSDDLTRYHDKFLLVDRRVLFMLSFNFTHLDIDHSRGFAVVSTRANWVREAARLFRADCTRTKYASKTPTFVVSPEGARKALDTFLKGAKTQLLIYDPKISDKEMLRVLHARAKAGVEIKVIGSVAGRVPFEVQKLVGQRLHTRTIIRDRRQAFVGSQSLRAAELDSRRELGLIVQDGKAVKTLIATFESDWVATNAKTSPAASKETEAPADEPATASAKEAAKAVQVLAKEMDPLAVSVKEAVKKAVADSAENMLNDKDVKHTMKKVVKQAVKDAVKEAVKEVVQDAQDAKDVKEAKDEKAKEVRDAKS